MPGPEDPGVTDHPEAIHRGRRRNDPVPRRRRCGQGCGDQEYAAADPADRPDLPAEPNQIAQPRRLDGGAGEHPRFAEDAMDQGYRDRGDPRTLQEQIAHRASLDTLVYGDRGRTYWSLSIQ